jgi:integrase
MMEKKIIAQLPELINAFDGHLGFVARAKTTRIKYRQSLDGFAKWAGERTIRELDAADLERYFADWQSDFEERYDRAPTAATRKNKISALRSFYDYLERWDYLQSAEGSKPNPMRRFEAPKVPKKANDWLTKQEDLSLLGATETPAEDIVVWLLRWTGIRASEANALRISDVHITPGAARVVVGQGKTDAAARTIPIPPELLPRIYNWLAYLDAGGNFKLNGPFLATKTGKPMATSYMGRIVKRVAHRAGVRCVDCTCGATTKGFHHHKCPQSANGEYLSTISPHTLRRTYGSYFLNEGVRLEAVSKLLGHSSTVITQKAYAELLDITVKTELHKILGWAA